MQDRVTAWGWDPLLSKLIPFDENDQIQPQGGGGG